MTLDQNECPYFLGQGLTVQFRDTIVWFKNLLCNMFLGAVEIVRLEEILFFIGSPSKVGFLHVTVPKNNRTLKNVF